MPTCQSCGKTWTWKKTFRKLFTLGTVMVCPDCGKKQYMTAKTRKLGAFFSFLAPIIMLVTLLFDLSPLWTLGGILVSFVIVIGLYPFWIKLANEEEPLW
ncbi:TIGR04104 family putative zinc finger protein [Oceanobacillus halotolerans]|uniref:TIGR04104 family putative zinc finger protein n=1 Tax=Oceanobacillus halotolerans TaxID=2663380 RepID=UPI0013D990C0|nr:TIGR04104 family putative zinc finger protein [Oceanobacillus halotolerans]